MHQLTDLPRVLDDEAQLAAAYPRNARIRTEGTRNLVAAANAAAARRFIVQSVAFAYAPGKEPHAETDPLNLVDGPRLVTVRAAADMEAQVLESGMEAIVLRYGLLYGPGTWSEGPSRKPPLHVDAAAQAALLAVTRGSGIYNIADDDGTVAIEKARNELGFDPAFRLAAERLTEKARAFEAVTPRLFDRLGDADARSDDNLHRLRARKERERRLVERHAVLGVGDAAAPRRAGRARSKAAARRQRHAGAAWPQALRSARCARISTALAEPFGSQTKFTHQWMP